jgi:hypothetical protein
MNRRLALGLGAVVTAACASAAGPITDRASAEDRIDVARFDAQGGLMRPADLDEWVHVGSALGMSYNEALPDPGNGHPPFTVVTMEPTAYRHFKEHGAFAEGTMFHLQPYVAIEDEIFPDADGLATGMAIGGEIHLQDAALFPSESYGFYFLDPAGGASPALPEPNACVTCHAASAGYDGAFVQFYPKLLEELMARGVALKQPEG